MIMVKMRINPNLWYLQDESDPFFLIGPHAQLICMKMARAIEMTTAIRSYRPVKGSEALARIRKAMRPYTPPPKERIYRFS